MVAIFKYFVFILLLSLTFYIFPQEEQIKRKEAELTGLKTEIKKLENELAEKTKKEKESAAILENYNRQNFLINKLIGNLRTEVNLKQQEIDKIEKQIKALNDEINSLKENYSRYIVAVYKKGFFNEYESLVNSQSLQQALYRIHYLKKFSEHRENDLQKLKKKKKELSEKEEVLGKEKLGKAQLVLQKEDEKKQLQLKLNQRRNIIESVKKDRKELQKLLDTKMQAHKQIEVLIAQMIEEAERRKEEERRKQLASVDGTIVNETEAVESGTEYDLSTETFSSFNNLKGKMLWPLHDGRVISKFGENKNKKLNTITINYGIDIKSGGDLNVRCVAEGVVSAIDWIPGYGSVIIVSHKGNYRTVYGHLSEIFVNEGDKISAGSLLALVDESIDGYVLHFEIWNGRDKKNPELWLAKK